MFVLISFWQSRLILPVARISDARPSYARFRPPRLSLTKAWNILFIILSPLSLIYK